MRTREESRASATTFDEIIKNRQGVNGNTQLATALYVTPTEPLTMANSTVETDPGYGFLEEGMAVEEDHMGEGALRFTLVGLALLVVMIAITIQWAKYEGTAAANENAVYEPSPLLRQMEAQAAEKLNRYDVVDPQNGRYRIPIDRAMTIIATEHAAQESGE